MSFACPRCGNDTTNVVDTRPHETDTNYSVRRKRTCPRCQHPFVTRELLYTGPNRHKLTLDDVKRIRFLRTKYHLLHRELAEQFGVTQTTITRIINRTRWD